MHDNCFKLICIQYFYFLSSDYQDIAVPSAGREQKGKRKRERTSEGDGSEDAGEENICPNSSVDKTTPLRKARGQTKGSQKLGLSSGAGAAKAKGTGEEEEEEELLLLSHVLVSLNLRLFLYFSAASGATEAQGIVGRTPPQSAARTKSRQAKAPTQAGEFVRTHYIPLCFHLCGLGWLTLTALIPALQLAKLSC